MGIYDIDKMVRREPVFYPPKGIMVKIVPKEPFYGESALTGMVTTQSNPNYINIKTEIKGRRGVVRMPYKDIKIMEDIR